MGGLSAEETKSRCTTLGLSAALMIAFGYPGEVTGEVAPRMLFWFISMIPFCYIVYLPNRVPLPSLLGQLRRQGWPHCCRHDLRADWLHCLRPDLQVRCRIPGLPHCSRQVQGCPTG